MGKGEIARYERFLLFPQCFQKAGFPGASKGVVVWEWVNPADGIVNRCMVCLPLQIYLCSHQKKIKGKNLEVNKKARSRKKVIYQDVYNIA